MASIQKLKAFIAVFDHYYLLKRGEKEDNRDLFKILSTQPKVETELQSEYTVAYSKTPHGMTDARLKGVPLIDPAVGSRFSTSKVWLRHLYTELDSKFKSLTDAFRQFNISKQKHVSFQDFNFILDTLSIRFSKEQTREMFDAMDSDCDGKLTYGDFVNLGESVKTDQDISTLSSFYSGTNTIDPYLQMAKDVEQRKEFDMMEWEDEIQGSKNQKRFKLKNLTKGNFSPREFGGAHYFDSKISFLNQQCHGLPTGFSTEEKKLLKRKIVGGNMYGVLHNQYWADGIIEAKQRETQYHQKQTSEKLDYAKFFNTRTT